MAKKSFYKIEMLFLKILEKEDCYGYQLTQSIQDITNGQIKIAEGTMYPILYKLQDQGYISDRQVKVGKRQTRVYYHLFLPDCLQNRFIDRSKEIKPKNRMVSAVPWLSC